MAELISDKKSLQENVFIALANQKIDGTEIKKIIAAAGSISAKDLKFAEGLAQHLAKYDATNAAAAQQIRDAIVLKRDVQTQFTNVWTDFFGGRADNGPLTAFPPTKQLTQAQVKEVSDKIATIQNETAAQKIGGATEVGRGFHFKGHGLFLSSFELDASFPQRYRYGAFAKDSPQGLVRFSSGNSCPAKDKAPDVHGLAIKLLNVGPQGESFDITATTSLPFARNVKEFGDFGAGNHEVNKAGNPLKLVPELVKAGIPPARALVMATIIAKQTLGSVSVAQAEYISGMDIPVGPYRARVKLVPVSEDTTTLIERVAARAKRSVDRWFGDDENAQRSMLKEILSEMSIKYEVRLQFATDGDGLDDPHKPWKGPWVKAGQVTIPQVTDWQKQKLVEAYGEKLAFGPQNDGGGSHEPSGAMKERVQIYKESAKRRGAIPDPVKLPSF